MSSALYHVVDDSFVPTPLTRGGWSDDAQHGGPPSGLLARAVEMVPAAAPMQIVRFTVDLFRAVPLLPLAVDTSVLRDGRRIQVVEARLVHDGTLVGRATALKIRTTHLAESVDLPVGSGSRLLTLPDPRELEPLEYRQAFGPNGEMDRFHTDAIEIRTVDRSFVLPVRGRTWFRLLHPLVEGEEITPFQRAAVMADLANGNSQSLDPMKWLFVNPDITLYLHRLPTGDWLGMDSVSYQTPEGLGTNETALFDMEGRIGAIGQAQLIEPRPPPDLS